MLATPLALDESLFHPLPSPPYPPAPSLRLFSTLLSPLLVPSISTTPLQQRQRDSSVFAFSRKRAQLCAFESVHRRRAYPDCYNNGRVCECVRAGMRCRMHRCVYQAQGDYRVGGRRGIGGTAKVRTLGRATPTGEEAEDEEGARFLPRARSCSNTVAPYVASLYTVERVTPHSTRRSEPRHTTTGVPGIFLIR